MCDPDTEIPPPPVVYRLETRDGKIANRWLRGKLVRTFQKPGTQAGLLKLYVVKHGDDIIYVGHTLQPMANRLRTGFKAQGEHGYWGYQWKDLEWVNLLIWFFPNEERYRVEAIEAELVYLVRRNTGRWPQGQTEIHFHNVPEETRAVATEIYETFLSNSSLRGHPQTPVGERSQ